MRVMSSRALAAAAVAALALIAGCGGAGPAADAGSTAGTGSSADPHASHGSAGGSAAFEGGLVEPRRAAPPLRLREIGGGTLDIRRLAGDPVLVTFVFARCPDVCPLIMETLAAARDLAGPAGERTRVVAVSVDPEGDTPGVVREFLAARRLDGVVSYLVGTRPQLEAAWRDWGVATTVPRDDPALIEHTALIYGVSAGGDLTTAYPVGVEAAAVARDLPRLAGS